MGKDNIYSLISKIKAGESGDVSGFESVITNI